ncbi:MAG: hypothetical protein AB1665_02725 [Candidatus Thermoplasmatota archaeon]
MKVGLYVNSKGYASTRECYNAPEGESGSCYGAISGFRTTLSTDHVLSEKEQKIRDALQNLSEKYRFDLEIHDIALKSERRRARLKGIRHTPLLVIGNRKIKDIPSDEESLRKLIYSGAH